MQGTREKSSPYGMSAPAFIVIGALKACLSAASSIFSWLFAVIGSALASLSGGGRLATNGHRGERGSGMTELVVVLPALLMLGLGAMQSALMYNAKNTVAYATFEAARMGAVNNAQSSAMRDELGVRIAPIFGGDGSPQKAANAIARGMLEANDPQYTRIRILNPTEAAFNDFGVENDDGVMEIPNSHLRYRSREIETDSLLNIQDANILKVEVTYAYRLTVPLVNRIIPSVLTWADPENADLYAMGRIPVTSVATVRMQSPAMPDGAAVPGGDDSGGGTVPGGIPPEFSTTTETVNPDGSTTTTTTTLESDGTITQTEQTEHPDGSVTTVTTVKAPDGTVTTTTEHTDASGGDGGGDGSGDDDGSDDDDGFECTTTWDDDEFQFVESDGWWDVFSNMPQNLTAAKNIVESFFDGLIAGLGDQVKDLVEVMTNPSIVWDVAKAAMEDPIGFLESIIEQIGQDVQTLMECGPHDIGRFVGQNVQPVVFIRAVGILSKSTRLQKYADIVDGRKNGDGDGDGGDGDDNIVCELNRQTSFVAGTPILTPNGTLAIEQIDIGQLVASRDEHSLQSEPRAVTQTFTRVAPGYHRLTTGQGTLEVTPEHPFWVQGKGWTRVDQIESNDLVASAKGDVLVQVNRAIDEPVRVYNFSVAKTPNYFAGDGGLWVHNCNPTPRGSEKEAYDQVQLLPNKDNYSVYTLNGMVVIRRLDPNVGDKLQFIDGKVQVYKTRVDIKAKIHRKPSKSHSELNDLDVELPVGSSTTGGTRTVNFKAEMDEVRDQRARAMADRDAANAMPAGSERDAALNEAYKDMRAASEKLGDLAATAYIKSEFPDARRLESRLPGNGKSGEFDHIYVQDGKVIIVEAKGGGADWGTRRQGIKDGKAAQQGSRQYMDSIIKNYQETLRSDSLSAAEAQSLRETVNAIKNATDIQYIGIKQKAGNAGVSDSLEVYDFEI